MKRKVKQTEWKTRDGRILKICDMTTSHLKNTVKYLRVRGYVTPDTFESCAMYAFSSLAGDMAQMAAENELMSMFPSSRLARMEDELRNRGERI